MIRRTIIIDFEKKELVLKSVYITAKGGRKNIYVIDRIKGDHKDRIRER